MQRENRELSETGETIAPLRRLLFWVRCAWAVALVATCTFYVTSNANARPIKRVVVAVIDSGVGAEHPMLAGRVLPGMDFLGLGTNSKLANNFGIRDIPSEIPLNKFHQSNSKISEIRSASHGTEVASLIVGLQNGETISRLGVNPKAIILPIRAFGVNGASQSDVIASMYWAAGFEIEGVPKNSFPARIINLSMNVEDIACRPEFAAATKHLSDRGIFIIAAAGNNYGAPATVPAVCPGVISVGAFASPDKVASYSALDPRITVYAPGGVKAIDKANSTPEDEISVASFEVQQISSLVSLQTGIRKNVHGTSYSAPIVAGFISLMLEKNDALTPAEFVSSLQLFGRRIPTDERCASCNMLALDWAMLGNFKVVKKEPL
jgi:serine protease